MWEFKKSSTNASNWLMGHSKEVAFIGRSNVGKSSLINALTNVKNLARTSNTPGRTQLINFFQNDDLNTIVDLPGYGYAKMPNAIKNEMMYMINNYFENRKELVKIFVLLDSKVGPTKDDINMIDFINEKNIPIQVVLTKSDKTNQSSMHKTMVKLKELKLDVIVTSVLKKKNIGQLRRILLDNF